MERLISYSEIVSIANTYKPSLMTKLLVSSESLSLKQKKTVDSNWHVAGMNYMYFIQR